MIDNFLNSLIFLNSIEIFSAIDETLWLLVISLPILEIIPKPVTTTLFIRFRRKRCLKINLLLGLLPYI